MNSPVHDGFNWSTDQDVEENETEFKNLARMDLYQDSSRLEELWTDEELKLVPYPTIKFNYNNGGDAVMRYRALFIKMHNYINGTQMDFGFFARVWCALVLDTPEFFEYQGKSKPFLQAHSYEGSQIPIEFLMNTMKKEAMGSCFSGSLKFRHYEEKDKFCEIQVDDRKFYEWYMNPNNLLKARAYFGLLCINMLRILLTQESDARVLIMAAMYLYYGRFSRIERPPVQPNVTQEFVERAGKKGSKASRKIIKGTFRLLVEYFHKDGTPEDNITNPCLWALWSYAIKRPLEYRGLHAIQIMDDLLEKDVRNGAHLTLMNSVNVCLQVQYNEYAVVKGFLALIRDQDEDFIDRFPKFRGNTAHCFMFSRLFNASYLNRMVAERLKELIAFALGYSESPLERITEVTCLGKLTEQLRVYHKLGRSAFVSSLSSVESGSHESNPTSKKLKFACRMANL